MATESHADRILCLLPRSPGLDDDAISDVTGIRPRQQVNQICRRLEAQGLVRRVKGSGGKLVTYRAWQAGDSSADSSVTPYAQQAGSADATPAPARRRAAAPPLGLGVLPSADAGSTLFIIPCSAGKETLRHTAGRAAPPSHGASILDHLPPQWADQLTAARRALRTRAEVDESTVVPAWQRYRGALYRSAGDALAEAVARGYHVLILSGGYGVVLAAEPIGLYEARFRRSWWPRGLLEGVLLAYAEHHRLRAVRAVASTTTEYRKLIDAVVWQRAGIDDAVLLTPEAARGALVKAPRAEGEVLSALLRGSLTPRWVSSDGLAVEVRRLS